MSYAVDANVLIEAVNRRGRVHEKAIAFLKTCAASPEPLCLTWGVLSAFCRISTHPRIFSNPLSPDEAVAAAGNLLSIPHTKVLLEEEGFWPIYEALSKDVQSRGNLVTDTHLAALLQLHSVPKLYTRDRDFRKFRHLEVIDPLE